MQQLQESSHLKTEHEVITDFTNYKENTMNEVVASSVGKVLLMLTEQYFTKSITSNEIDLLYKACLNDLEAGIDNIAPHYPSKTTFTNESERIEQNKAALRKSLEFIKNKINEPVDSDFDSFTIFYPPNISQKYIVPLKEVLVLLWKALTDDLKFAHNYQGTPQEKNRQAKKDRVHRLLSLFLRLELLQRTGVCHQGNRNELVFLLKRSYLEVDIIEDAQITTYAFLRENIFNAFLQSYDKAENKQKLISSLMLWMSDHNPQLLANTIDEKLQEQLKKELFEFFIKHGSNPANHNIQKFVNNAFRCLEFSCSPEKYPLLYKAAEIFRASSNQKETQLALIKMQDWVKNNVEAIHDEVITKTIADFLLLFQAQEDYFKNQVLIKVNGKITDEINNLLMSCQKYFDIFDKEDKFENVTTETLSNVALLRKIIHEVKNDKLIQFIENFFTHWFLNENSICDIYEILLNEDVQDKIKLTDEEIKKYWQTTYSSEKDITPFEINRVFLHAIIVNPADWSEMFFSAFTTVLKFVKLNFNNNANLLAVKLKKDAYPEFLIKQLDYLEDRYQVIVNNKEAICPRPQAMILLPESIKTWKEWVYIATPLAKTKISILENIYRNRKIYFEKILRIGVEQIINTDNVDDIKQLLSSVPEHYRKDFIDSIKNHITRYIILKSIVKFINYEDRFIFLQNFLNERPSIVNGRELARLVMSNIALSRRQVFLESINDSLKTMIQTCSDVEKLLKLPSMCHYLIVFNLSSDSKFVAEIADFEKLKGILDRLAEECWPNFITHLYEYHIKNQNDKDQRKYFDIFYTIAETKTYRKVIKFLFIEEKLFGQAIRNRKLRLALELKNDDYATAAINDGADVNFCEENQIISSLRLALNNNCFDSAKLMIEKYDPLDIKHKGNSLLVSAFDRFFLEQNLTIKLEIRQLIKLMVEKGFNLNFQTRTTDDLPLVLAVVHNEMTMLDYLIEKGCLINISSAYGNPHCPALFKAVINKNEIATIKLLKEGAVLDLNYVSDWVSSPLVQEVAVLSQNFKMGKLAFEQNSSGYKKYFELACTKNKAYFKEMLLHWSHKLNIHQRKSLVIAPIIKKGLNFELLRFLYNKSVDEIDEKFLNEKSKVNFQRLNLPTPLLWALNSGSFDTAKLIIEKNLFINDSYRNHTPLTLALQKYYQETNSSSKEKYKKLIELLIQRNASLNPKIKNEHLPLTIAASQTDIDMMSYLIAQGSEVNVRMKNDKQHSPALFEAILHNNESEILYLLKLGAVLDQASFQENTMMRIDRRKFLEVQSFCDNFYKAKKHFVQQGANYEQFLKIALNANKKYFKTLVLQWANDLNFEERKILANSPSVKKAFGFELLCVLYNNSNQIEKKQFAKFFSENKVLFRQYKYTDATLKKHGKYTNFLPSPPENLEKQYRNLIKLKRECLVGLAKLTGELGRKKLSKNELWSLKKFHAKHTAILKNTKDNLKKYQNNIFKFYTPLNRNMKFFSNYLIEHISNEDSLFEQKHSKERIAYCLKFITDMNKNVDISTQRSYQIPLLNGLYELKGLLLAETQEVQSKSYFNMLFNCAMTSQLAQHVEHEIKTIEKYLTKPIIDFHNISAHQRQLVELDNNYGTAWRRFKTALRNLVMPVTLHTDFDEKRKSALRQFNC